MPAKKLIVIAPYFGERVRWMDFFLASCAANPEVDWLLITDFDLGHRPANVKHLQVSFDTYRDFIQRKLDLTLAWRGPYKLCDLKPALGYLHYDLVQNYEFWGYSDIDLVYGDILGHYEPFMREFDVIASHTYLLAGHFAVYRAIEETLTLFSRHDLWKEKLAQDVNVHFDEKYMTYLLIPHWLKMSNLRFAERLVVEPEIGARKLKALFKEQYTTYNGEDWLLPGGRLGRPTTWAWDRGVVTNDAMPGSILYGHFSHWASGRWGATSGEDAGAWSRLDAQAFPQRPYDEIGRFTVSREGFRIVD